jgi:hypothetical protein
MDINRVWESIRGNIYIASAIDSLAYHELKQHKPRFGEECLKLFYHRKQAKLQW